MGNNIGCNTGNMAGIYQYQSVLFAFLAEVVFSVWPLADRWLKIKLGFSKEIRI